MTLQCTFRVIKKDEPAIMTQNGQADSPKKDEVC